jgi:hypothetical protein
MKTALHTTATTAANIVTTAAAALLLTVAAANTAPSLHAQALPFVPAARQPVRQPTEDELLRQRWKIQNENWMRANVDGRITSMFDVRKRVSQIIQSAQGAAIQDAHKEVADALKLNPAELDVFTPPSPDGTRGPSFQLRRKHLTPLPPEIQTEFKQKATADIERRLATTPGGISREQAANEALIAVREELAKARGAKPDDWEIAQTEDREIILRAVQWELLPPNVQQEFARRADEKFRRIYLPNIESDTLKTISNDQLLIREARERGVNLPASMMTARIEEAIKREPDSDRTAFFTKLDNEGASLREEKRRIEEDTVADFMRREVLKHIGDSYFGDIERARISPKRIQERYEKEKHARFATPPTPALYSYRQIRLTPTPGETDLTIREQAAHIVEEVKKGTPFTDLLKRDFNKASHSQDGAEIWHEATTISEKILNILTTLPDGGVSPPIELSRADGHPDIYFIQRAGHKPSVPGTFAPLETVQDLIANELIKDEKKATLDDFLDRLGGEHGKFFKRYYDNRE